MQQDSEKTQINPDVVQLQSECVRDASGMGLVDVRSGLTKQGDLIISMRGFVAVEPGKNAKLYMIYRKKENK